MAVMISLRYVEIDVVLVCDGNIVTFQNTLARLTCRGGRG